MDAGIVDEDLDRPGFEDLRQRRRGLRGIGDVETHGLGGAASGDDRGGQRLGARELAMGMDIDMMPGSGEGMGDGGADDAAAAGDQSAAHGLRRTARWRGRSAVPRSRSATAKR